MPHLWMFLLQSLTPPEHNVFLIDGNAQPMTESLLAELIRIKGIKLVGIGAMTRMAARAYRMADAARAAGALVVMGGPHVTEVPDEPLGRDGGPRHVDAVALGEADATWPQIVADAANGTLREIYSPVDALGKEIKPSLADYPAIPWNRIDLTQFDLIGKLPSWFRWSRAAGVHTGVTFARSPVSSAIRFAFAATRAWSTKCWCSSRAPVANKERSESFLSTTISRSTSSAPNRCCEKSSRMMRSCPGWR